jgi:ADP-heptose:LPS heptosyltransferase
MDRFNILITGNSEEGTIIQSQLPDIFSMAHVTNVTGKFSLEEFIIFVQCCDGLLAGSTGPLHIAALSGKHALGLYPSRRPMHAMRWAPIGDKAEYISEPDDQGDFLNIPISVVHKRILAWLDH